MKGFIRQAKMQGKWVGEWRDEEGREVSSDVGSNYLWCRGVGPCS